MIDIRLITGLSIVLYLLAVAVAVWCLLGPGREALSRVEMTRHTRRKIFLLLILALLVVPGLYMVPNIILALRPCPGLPPVDYIPSLPGFSVARSLSIRAAVVFLLALLFTLVALLVTSGSWSREKMGWILLLMGFIPDLFEPLLTMKLTDVWHPVAITRLSMNLTDVSFALWLTATAMFLISAKGKKRGQVSFPPR